MKSKKSIYKNEDNQVYLINEELKEFSLEDFSTEELFEFDNKLTEYENIVRKFILKKRGKDLEDDKHYDAAIDYYNSILNNNYFSNDYYIYRRLIILYERNQPEKQLDILKQFFKNDIYASEYQIRWMVHKLFRLEESGYIRENELDELILYYDEHGSEKKDLENYPVVLAERIFQKYDGSIAIKTQFKYEKQQRKYELTEIGAELERTKKYEDALDFYWDLIEQNVNGATDFYKRLAYIYDKHHKYNDELYVLSLFFKKKFNIVGLNTKNEFKDKLNNVNLHLGTNYTIEDLIDENFSIDNKNQLNDDLFRYVELYEKGYLTREEFEIIKKEVISNLTTRYSVKNKSHVSNNSNFVRKQFSDDSSEKIITVGSNNFSTLLKSNMGDEIIAQIVNRPHIFTKLQIVNIHNQKIAENFNKNVIKISEENFNIIKNLMHGELITIKSKGRRGKVILKPLNNEVKKDQVNSFKKHEDKTTIKYDNIQDDEIVNEISNSKNKYIYNIQLSDKYKLDFNNPFEFNNSLSDEENIQRKFILKDTGNSLTFLKQYEDAIDFYEYLKNNSYYENDWYPYRQLTMIYERKGKHQKVIENIKQLFYSGIYCNGYQYIWFIHKLNNALEHVKIDENEIGTWLDYYQKNGANNKDKLDTPIFIADRIVKKDDRIRVYSKDIFYNNYQKLNEYQEKVRFSEQIDDYESALNAIKCYYQEYYSKISHQKTMWFRKKLNIVNKKLGTNYNFKDFI